MRLALRLGTTRPLGDSPPAVPPFPFPTVATRLRYRPESGGSWVEVAGTAMGVPDTNRVVHTVHIEGLAPDTTYEIDLPNLPNTSIYTTYCDDPTTTLTVHWHTLKPLLGGGYANEPFSNMASGRSLKSFTAPSSIAGGEFRVAQLSDTHGQANEVDLIVAASAADHHLIVHSGDVATGNGGTSSPQTWYQFFNDLRLAVDTQGRTIPFIPNIGNHEVRGGGSGLQWLGDRGFKPDFNTGQRGDAEWYYCFFPRFPGLRGFGLLDFGDYLSVFVIDPGISTLLEDPSDNQRDWLETALSARQTVPHKIATLHYSPWPVGRRPMNLSFRTVREVLGPVWHAGGVRVVLVGHDHVLSYTVPIDSWGLADHQSPQTPAAVGDGIEFFGAGPAGGRAGPGARSGRNPATKWWMADSRASIWEQYDFEEPGWDGPALEAETRDPHPDDMTEFGNDDVRHYWSLTLTPTGRQISAVTAEGETWVTLDRGIDPDMSE